MLIGFFHTSSGTAFQARPGHLSGQDGVARVEYRKTLPDNALVLAGDDHRDAGRGYHVGAGRAEQQPGGPAQVVAADHDELEMARRLIDQTQQCTVNLGSVARLHIVVGDLDRIDDDLAGLFSVSLMELSGDRGGGQPRAGLRRT